mmetsp:Transcript_248/g.410  ORF Transcript_248/g.410 Transcript_248/m.410 type:complete len:1405 (+) Transcript_248:358-4572(+)
MSVEVSHGVELHKGQSVWVPGSHEWVWEMGTVEEVISKGECVVLTQSQSNVLTNVVYPSNQDGDTGVDDMTSMTHINEPAILSNLHKRALKDKPYTFMGPVMVAVNPLRKIDSKLTAGDPAVSNQPHPFAVAESAYQQLKFACNQVNRGMEPDTPVSQTVVVGGESGAGKTESSKMVLRHLVARNGGGTLDKKLLGNNVILESFGNAQTLRNANSSRFGKLLKLHFDEEASSIVGASISTYLLERSRVTTHEHGERGYHVFYQLLVGLSKDKDMHVSPKTKYAYLSPGDDKYKLAKPAIRDKTDLKEYNDLCAAFKDIGMSAGNIKELFKAVAGVLLLGNIEFYDEEKAEGLVATVKSNESAKAALVGAGSVLGFSNAKAFVKLFTERKIRSGGSGTITTYNNSGAATKARDAVARTLYARIFNYVLDQINASIDDGNAKEDQPKIGVLDIFGFESFQHNGFEQLLINYTNESLQATFNEQVFHSEAELYKREQLVVDASSVSSPPKGNSECMFLLEGERKSVGVLDLITLEAQNPGASDSKFNDKIHKTFRGKNASFGKVHPKNIDRNFIVIHYAGPVVYTVGSFLVKNADSMPNEVNDIFKSSTHPLMAAIWSSIDISPNDSKKKRRGHDSIVAKFKSSIIELKDYLNSTRCSFIRCVKPNALMVRNSNEDFFDRRYITSQLKSLSVLQTAEVLKNGLPTRVSYAELTDTYMALLPEDALKAWRGLGGGSVTAFIAALFWAFEIPRESYKLGLTRVFFASGMLGELEAILNASSSWGKGKSKEKDAIVARFRRYFAQRRWHVAFAAVRALNMFSKIGKKTTERRYAAVILQKWYRSSHATKRYQRMRWAAVVFQKHRRRQLARKIYKKRLKQHLKKIEAEEREKKAKLEADKRERKAAEERAEALRQERLRKEQEMAEAEARKIAAEAKMKEIKAREKKLTGGMKTMNDRLMAKRRKQLQELEDSGNFLDSPYNDSKKDTEYHKLQEEKQAEKEILEEAEAQRNELQRELEAAKEEEEENMIQVSELENRVALSKNEYDEAFKHWRKVRQILNDKKARQLEHLESNNESAGTWSMDNYLRRREAEKRGVNSKHKNLAIQLLKSNKPKHLRPSEKHLTATPLDDEDETSTMDGYNIREEEDVDEIKPSYTAEGAKMRVKQGGFRLFNGWRNRQFTLTTKDNRIRWHPLTGTSVRRSIKDEPTGVFCLNDMNSKLPPKLTKNPPKYKRKNVLEIQNGYLKEDQTSVGLDKRNRVLVIAFKHETDLDQWMKALQQFDSTVKKKTSLRDSIRKSLGRKKSVERPEEVEDEAEEECKLSDDDVLDSEFQEDQIRAWTTRVKKTEKLNLSGTEQKKLLANAVIRGENDEEEEVIEQSFPNFCKSCNTTQEITKSSEICPGCGTRIPLN